LEEFEEFAGGSVRFYVIVHSRILTPPVSTPIQRKRRLELLDVEMLRQWDQTSVVSLSGWKFSLTIINRTFPMDQARRKEKTRSDMNQSGIGNYYRSNAKYTN
jgi:hypothetical protein